jgi:hypothetical protein
MKMVNHENGEILKHPEICPVVFFVGGLVMLEYVWLS